MLAPGHPESHVVQKGDTLWDIASRFLAQPWRWPEIWRINPQIEDPHLIYPGDTIRLVYREGEPPFLTLERGGAGQPSGLQPGQQPGLQPGQQPGLQAGGAKSRFVKLSPQVRVYPREQSISALPLHEIQHYLADVRVVPGKESEGWPYVLSTVIDSTAHRVYAAVGKVYVRGTLNPDQANYSVYRERRLYRDADLPDRILGQELIYVGEVEVVQFGDPSIGFIKTFKFPLKQGDRLYVEKEGEREGEIDSLVSLLPRPPSREVSGKIIDILGGIVVAGARRVVVLDVGENEGLEPGNILAIQQQEIRFTDPLSAELLAKQKEAERIRFQYEDVSATDNLLSSIFNDVRGLANAFNRTDLVGYIGGPYQHPEQVVLDGQKNGNLLVFRTFPEISYGLIMDIDFPVYLHDLVSNP